MVKNSHSLAYEFELDQSECESLQAITSTRKKQNLQKHVTLFGQDLQSKLVVIFLRCSCKDGLGKQIKFPSELKTKTKILVAPQFSTGLEI